MDALLLLEDGAAFRGRSFTGRGEVFGELVFNTGMTGYQELITDPSYAGQVVIMTMPMIGTYGIRGGEDESSRVHVQGLVVREYAGVPEPVRNPVTGSLASTLAEAGALGIEEVDTRALTRRIRDKGAMRCGLSTETLDERALLDKVLASPSMVGRNLVPEVTTTQPYLFHDGAGPRVAVLDCGVKAGSLNELARRDCRVEVFPASTCARDLLAARPDGLLLSNGPGDPAALPHIVATVAELLERLPIFGICLGHQILGQALGARTFKLPFGHHGCNHPVREEATGKVYITSQNHGFAVDPSGLGREVRASFLNLNDRTNEGLVHTRLPLSSVQFHPEAAPGPHDTRFLFDDFLKLMRESSGAGRA